MQVQTFEASLTLILLPNIFVQSYLIVLFLFRVSEASERVLAKTAIEFPPMQGGASFNLDAVKKQIEAARKAAGAN